MRNGRLLMRNMNQLLAVTAGTAAAMSAGCGVSVHIGTTGEQKTTSCDLTNSIEAIAKHLHARTSLNSLVLEDPNNPEALIKFRDPAQNISMTNPLVEECANQVVAYAARQHYDDLVTADITSTNVRITEYIGHKAVAIANPQKAGFVVSRTLRGLRTAGRSGRAPSFTDGKKSYGLMP
jgi:hypothetical protein